MYSVYLYIYIYIYRYICFLHMGSLAQILKWVPGPWGQLAQKFVHPGGPSTWDPGPVLGPWAHEKLRFLKNCFRQSSPRCSGMLRHGVIFAKFDLPEMDYNAVRSFEGSRWTIMHLGEVQFCKKSRLWLHPDASRGAISKPKMHDCHATIFEVQARFQNRKCTIESKKS